jgi:hypothetical protein
MEGRQPIAPVIATSACVVRGIPIATAGDVILPLGEGWGGLGPAGDVVP